MKRLRSEPAEKLAGLSNWIDHHNRDKLPELQLWERCGKAQEEAGEVAGALIGLLGQNPRKGFTHDMTDVETELLDLAVTALGAVEHINGNNGSAMTRLYGHIAYLYERAIEEYDNGS